jgi:hypothetical protein
VNVVQPVRGRRGRPAPTRGGGCDHSRRPKAQGLLDGAPDFVFSPAGDVRVVQDLGYLAWNLGPEGQPPVVRGVDVALVEGGLIARVYTLLLAD